MKKVNNKKIFGGLIWTFGERISAQLVSTLVTIVLARLLDPSHYGVISIVTVFISFLNVFVSGGFDSALVQKRVADDLDFNTAFWISFVVSTLLYILLFISAPAIEIFYNMTDLTRVIRVMGLRLIIASFNCIQQAYIRRKMQFKKFFWATLLGTVISGIAGVFLAYHGAGVWALVTQYLMNVTIDTIMLFIVGAWKPRFQFSFERARIIWEFGWKVLATSLVYTIEGDIRSLIVGKVFGSADLAYYDQGKKYPSILVTNINSSINKVMLPAYSKEQDNLDTLVNMLRRSIRIGIFLLAPLLFGFAAIAPAFVELVLSNKWSGCIPFIQILSISYLTRPLEESCHQALLSIGKSSIVLRCMVAINITAILFVFLAVFGLHSVLAIAWFNLLNTIISLFVFLYSADKYLGYSLKMQMSDIAPSLLTGCAMVVAVLLIGKAPFSTFYRLLLQILIGAISYICGSIAIKNESFYYLISFIRRRKD